jgi:hypothetical protein
MGVKKSDRMNVEFADTYILDWDRWCGYCNWETSVGYEIHRLFVIKLSIVLRRVLTMPLYASWQGQIVLPELVMFCGIVG